MNHTPHKGNLDEELTDEQKQKWDQIIETLWKYFQTEEGIEFYERFIAIFSKMPQKPELPVLVLSASETEALRFIRKELKRGHSPSVREVAKALGFKSSRSGHRVICSLRGKGLWQ